MIAYEISGIKFEEDKTKFYRMQNRYGLPFEEILVHIIRFLLLEMYKIVLKYFQKAVPGWL